MTQISTLLSLPFLQPNQAQKHVTLNVALERLDLLVQLVLQETGRDTPPAAPAEGQAWATGDAPSGAWTGHPREIAAWQEGGWVFVLPRRGWRAFLADREELVIFDGARWGVPRATGLSLAPGAAPAQGEAGDLYFDAAGAKLRCHDGTTWRDLF